MIVKMKFLSITGPKEDINRATEVYLSKYDIQLENVLTELKTVQDLRPYIEINPYKDALNKASEFLSMLDVSKDTAPIKDMPLETALNLVSKLDKKANQLRKQVLDLEETKKRYLNLIDKVEPFRELNYALDVILKFKFIKVRFGKISTDNYVKLEKYVIDNLDTLFVKCAGDKNFVWGIYFTPESKKAEVDAIFTSLNFERLHLPDEYKGTPEQAYRNLHRNVRETIEKINHLYDEIQELFNASKTGILEAYQKIKSMSSNFDVRKLAACTKNDQLSFYLLCGWMTEEDANKFLADVADDKNIYCIVEDDQNTYFSKPPTKLKNPKLFRPFEMFVKMYGLPAYNEFDPTIFLAFTYTFIFGCMFGDVGQGLFLVIGGALLYKFKKIDLAAIISLSGIFSSIFGFLYGSVFGFEDVIPALWIRPMETMITLPVIGTLNLVLVLAVSFGMAVILLSMVFNIINGIIQKNIEKIFFDTNGVAGLIFYGSLVASVVLIMTGHTLPGGVIILVMFLLPLLLIGLKEPIMAIIEKKSEVLPEEKGIFFVQAFFELFEVILSYVSNTISFVRIGAFALSHVGMMSAVMLLAGAENGRSPNWVVVVIGNLFVLGMEGLIVGIHVLRLEFYEMFSRYFTGSGREFRPYAKEKN